MKENFSDWFPQYNWSIFIIASTSELKIWLNQGKFKYYVVNWSNTKQSKHTLTNRQSNHRNFEHYSLAVKMICNYAYIKIKYIAIDLDKKKVLGQNPEQKLLNEGLALTLMVSLHENLSCLLTQLLNGLSILFLSICSR